MLTVDSFPPTDRVVAMIVAPISIRKCINWYIQMPSRSTEAGETGSEILSSFLRERALTATSSLPHADPFMSYPEILNAHCCGSRFQDQANSREIREG